MDPVIPGHGATIPNQLDSFIMGPRVRVLMPMVEVGVVAPLCYSLPDSGIWRTKRCICDKWEGAETERGNKAKKERDRQTDKHRETEIEKLKQVLRLRSSTGKWSQSSETLLSFIYPDLHLYCLQPKEFQQHMITSLVYPWSIQLWRFVKRENFANIQQNQDSLLPSALRAKDRRL